MKDPVKNMKSYATDREKKYAHHISYKGLISRTYLKSLKVNKQIQTIQLENEQKT